MSSFSFLSFLQASFSRNETDETLSVFFLSPSAFFEQYCKVQDICEGVRQLEAPSEEEEEDEEEEEGEADDGDEEEEEDGKSNRKLSTALVAFFPPQLSSLTEDRSLYQVLPTQPPSSTSYQHGWNPADEMNS